MDIEWYAIKNRAKFSYNWCVVKYNNKFYWCTNKYINIILNTSSLPEDYVQVTERIAKKLVDYKELKQHILKLKSVLYQELMK